MAETPSNATLSETADVSVIIPAHNRPDFMPACIQSVLDQDWQGRLEILCVDDGSSVDPFSRLSPAQLPDNVHLFRKPNAGVSAARRYAYERSKGRYIAFNDDDDIWLPGKLKKQIDFLEAHPDIDMIFGDLVEFTDEGDAGETYYAPARDVLQHRGQRLTSSDLPVYSFEPGSLIGPFMSNMTIFFQTVLVRRSLIERIGGIHPFARSAAECLDFALRTAHFGKLAFLDQPTFRLRRGHSHETARVDWLERELKEFFMIYPDYPPDLKRQIEPFMGHRLANKGWLHFKRAEYRAAASAYRDAARHGRIGSTSRLKWALAVLLGLIERERPSDKEKNHASTG